MSSSKPEGFRRSWDGVGSLSDEWTAVAADWIAWARSPHDSYWRFHRDRFLELLPPPPQEVADLGCGEGRLARDLKEVGYSVVAVDASPPMVAAARQADPEGRYQVADAAATGLPDASVDGVIAFMCLHDLDDMPGVIEETKRILRPRGWLAIAVVHPVNSGGVFTNRGADAPFCIGGSYLRGHKYVEEGIDEDDGLHMRFASWHRPMGAYFAALEGQGFVVDRLREVTVEGDADSLRDAQKRWLRVPLFLHLRAVAT